MASKKLKTVLDRVHTWLKGEQEEALKALHEIEEDFFIAPEATQR